MSTLQQKILSRQNGILLYGLTPPKAGQSEERLREIAEKQIARVRNLAIDGLVLYDIQSEAERTTVERPFPFIATVDPDVYSRDYLKQLALPKIVYRCVGKYSRDEFTRWLAAENEDDSQTSNRYSVFVGAAATKAQRTQLSMSEAYALRNKLNPDLILGGVTIPERHLKREDEHLRLAQKISNGCSFFVSQAVYNVEASKNLLSDYYYACLEQDQKPRPIIFTITPCGSPKTLEFMKWLGINIPRWLENDLLNSGDILQKSVDLCRATMRELIAYAAEKNLPIGCNVESVAVRKAEIEASVQLVEDIRTYF
ncbi:MAG: methylenetetrahydrofolate reductase [bacterium]|nr:methylenetetrahydrofolate reductase [bacterium]